jgi:hypothetical protein
MRIRATEAERRDPMPGDAWIGPTRGRTRLVMTRAVTIAAPPSVVWPWLGQLGRGAGWYSYDTLDNGRRASARHLVTWIPEPRVGDATAIGYLRHLEPGRAIAWWAPGERWLGSEVRMVASYLLHDVGGETRLIQRMTADAAGWPREVVRAVFAPVDLLMGRRQLHGIAERASRLGTPREDPSRPETGARDQFQLYAGVYASGERCGVPGKEEGERWHERAIADLGPEMGAPRS